jgi:hypothetical protein
MGEANRRRRPNARNYGKQKCAHDVIAGLQKGDEMGEANRRRGAQSTVIKGPFSYEVCLFGLDQIMAGGLIELLSDGPPSPRGVTIIKATANLAARMRDPGRPKMLCMSCDHEFERDEHPRRGPAVGERRASAYRQPDMRRLRRGRRRDQGCSPQGAVGQGHASGGDHPRSGGERVSTQ